MKTINKVQLMHPFDISVKRNKKVYKPKIHDFIYLFLCALIVIGFADNVERFIKSAVTPKVVEAQERIENARKALFDEQGIVSPTAAVTATPVKEVLNPFNKKSPKGIAWEINKTRFGIEHWSALEELITNESGWNPFATNDGSGACGLGQALPCSKMECENWDYECQVNWVADYIQDRYENPTKAWNHWLARVPIDGRDVGNWY